MLEDSETEDDDGIFDQVVGETDGNLVGEGDDVDVSSDEDVVIGLDGDFDEGKHSDREGEGPRFLVINPKVVLEPDFEVGMLSNNMIDFKKVVQSYTIKKKRFVWFSKNAPERCYARCKDPECEWKINLLKFYGEESYQIRVFDHVVSNVKSSWLVDKFLHRFEADPKRKISTFRQDVSDDLGINISKDQAARAKRLALKKLEGNPAAQYTKLWDYAEELMRTNPGPTVMVGSTHDGENRFTNLYICLDAVKRGFRDGYRKIIGVGGGQLKGPHKGILLAAVGVDANNNLYPLAWAVVTTESRDTWQWFLIALKHDLEFGGGYEYTFMFDKQKGLIQAFQEVFPDSEHRFCVRHLHGNFKSAGFRGQAYKTALWEAANVGTIPEWKKRMLELKAISEVTWEWLADKPADQWSKSHFTEQCKCDMLLNNVCESFNSSILEARETPILTMCEWIIVRFQKNRDVSQRWKGRICPKIMKILNKNIKMSATCRPIKCDHVHYQVRVTNGTQYTMNLADHSCSCRIWDIRGVPYKHAIFAIIHLRGDPEEYVDDWYSIERYQRSYAHTIKGVNGEILWNDTIFIPPLPPNMGRGKGRPASARRNEPDELYQKIKMNPRGRNPNSLKRRQISVTCRNCGQQGHNVSTCGRTSKTKKKAPVVPNSSGARPSRKKQAMERQAKARHDRGTPSASNQPGTSGVAQEGTSNTGGIQAQNANQPYNRGRKTLGNRKASTRRSETLPPRPVPTQAKKAKLLPKRKSTARRMLIDEPEPSEETERLGEEPERQFASQEDEIFNMTVPIQSKKLLKKKKSTARRIFHDEPEPIQEPKMLAEEPEMQAEEHDIQAEEPETQESEIFDMTVPTQSSQGPAVKYLKVPGPSMWDQLRRGCRTLDLSTKGGPRGDGRKFMSLADLKTMTKKK